MDHILAVLRTRDERGSGFTALGEMAGALGGELVPYLPTITLYLREAVLLLSLSLCVCFVCYKFSFCHLLVGKNVALRCV